MAEFHGEVKNEDSKGKIEVPASDCESGKNNTKMGLLSLAGELSDNGDDEFYGIPCSLSADIMPLSHLIKLMGLEEATSIEVEKKNITSARRVVPTAVALLPDRRNGDGTGGGGPGEENGQGEDEKEDSFDSGDSGESKEKEWSLAQPYTASVENARWLTAPCTPNNTLTNCSTPSITSNGSGSSKCSSITSR